MARQLIHHVDPSAQFRRVVLEHVSPLPYNGLRHTLSSLRVCGAQRSLSRTTTGIEDGGSLQDGYELALFGVRDDRTGPLLSHRRALSMLACNRGCRGRPRHTSAADTADVTGWAVAVLHPLQVRNANITAPATAGGDGGVTRLSRAAPRSSADCRSETGVVREREDEQRFRYTSPPCAAWQ